MKARIGGREIEIEESRVRGGVVGTRTRKVPMTGNVPNETGNTDRVSRLARNKVGAPVPIRGEAVSSLDCAGRGEAYNREAGLSRQLRTKEMGRSPKVGSNPAPSPSFDSKLEARYAQYLDCLVFAKEIQGYVYHPFSMRLPGPRNYHRPDFLMVRLDGVMEIHNTKGWHRNYRDSLTKIKVAAAMYPWFAFLIIKRIDHQWIRQMVMG